MIAEPTAAVIQPEALRIKLPVFEGPLDLLLYLIKRDEVDIYDIPIFKITEEYLQYLDLMKMLDLDLAGEYLVMAATLVYIKSRMLLPVEQQPPADDVEDDDPRWELIRQLVEYKKFKEAANQLMQQEAHREAIFPRPAVEPVFEAWASPATEPPGIFDLLSAFQKVLERFQEPENLRDIFEERYTVADKIQMMVELFKTRDRVLFVELFREAASRTEVVVTFLALLEMARLRRVKIRQSDLFADIEIARAEMESA